MNAPAHQPAELLKMALDEDATEWGRLHALCLDRATAEALAQMLHQAPLTAEARAWAHALEEMHRGLKVNLLREI
jgi:hypothetical protein